jgi:hypothetical protein
MEKKTIEEAADKWFQACGKNIYYDYDSRFAFIAGAKYQSEQMQDKIEEKWKKYRYQTNNEDAWMFKEWLINQFKKK